MTNDYSTGCGSVLHFVKIPVLRATLLVGVAQLVRAPDCGSGGRGFETRHPPHTRGRPILTVTSSIY